MVVVDAGVDHGDERRPGCRSRRPTPGRRRCRRRPCRRSGRCCSSPTARNRGSFGNDVETAAGSSARRTRPSGLADRRASACCTETPGPSRQCSAPERKVLTDWAPSSPCRRARSGAGAPGRNFRSTSPSTKAGPLPVCVTESGNIRHRKATRRMTSSADRLAMTPPPTRARSARTYRPTEDPRTVVDRVRRSPGGCGARDSVTLPQPYCLAGAAIPRRRGAAPRTTLPQADVRLRLPRWGAESQGLRAVLGRSPAAANG